MPGDNRPLISPLYPASVYVLPDLATLDAIMEGESPGFIYARDGHPNAHRLSQALKNAEQAEWAVVCSSGMAALSLAALLNVGAGDRLLAGRRLYGKTTALLRDELSRYGVETVFIDANDLEQVASALRSPARLMLVETMSNPLLRVVDIPALASLCRERGCRLLVDNTFATPVLCRPLSLGADFVVESLTKIISGHSDVTLGLLAGNNPDDGIAAAGILSTWGFSAAPFDCWLCERGLPTLELRVKAACENAHRLAKWLREQPQVSRVVYPGLDEHPDHEVARRLFGGYFGHVLCFELPGGREDVDHFLRRAPEIPFSPSLGHATTTLSHPASTSHRYLSPAEKRRQGITDGLIRLSVGVENYEVLEHRVARGLGQVSV